MSDPIPKRYSLATAEPGGQFSKPTWFDDPVDLRAHLHLLQTLPVEGGVDIRVCEYVLTRTKILKGTNADDEED